MLAIAYASYVCSVIVTEGTKSRPGEPLFVVGQCPELKDKDRKSDLFLFFGLLGGEKAQAACRPCSTRAKSGRLDMYLNFEKQAKLLQNIRSE